MHSDPFESPNISVSTTSTRDNRTGSWKYIRPMYRDGTAPCNQACPAGVDVEGYLDLLRQDRVEEALALLLMENPMPAVTGRGEAGGMLRQGIPAYRLPREILDRQIERIAHMGVDFRLGRRLDDDSARRVLDGYDAVFLATGAHRGRGLDVPGEDGPGVVPGLEFLKAVNRGERPDLGHRVAVIGGGNTAMDCARTALRLGSEPIVVYRRTREEMPAIPQEVEEAMGEGIEFMFLASPEAFLHRGGRLVAMHLSRMELGEPDESGRRRPVPILDGGFRIDVDTVLTAVGEDAERPADIDTCRWGEGTVSKARWRGEDPVRRTNPSLETVDIAALQTAHYPHEDRHPDRWYQGPRSFTEVNLGIDFGEAVAEAKRCFNCGVCNDCELCLIFCPDNAIRRREGGGFEIDLDYCKGCGLCAEECPRGAIVMTREGL
ncbi:MAG: FAD-dependent oxidoreductase [Gemmatimonadota bacterium]